MAGALDDLTAMAVFARVAELESFSAAARDLGLSKSAVSRAVSGLEESLGARLLHRTTRRVGLTEAGRELYARSARIVAEAEAARLAVGRLAEQPRGTVKVSAPVVFGETFLAPMLPGFLRAYPEVRLDVVLDDRLVDLVRDGFDVAVRISRLTDSSLVARKLYTDKRFVVASPDYLARRGTPDVPEDLVNHNCLRYTYVSPQAEWRFLGPDGEFSVAVTGNLETNHGRVMLEAVRQGTGLALLPWFIVGEDVRDGKLVTILDDWRPPESTGIWAVQPPSRQDQPKVRVFVEYLAEKLGRNRI